MTSPKLVARLLEWKTTTPYWQELAISGMKGMANGVGKPEIKTDCTFFLLVFIHIFGRCLETIEDAMTTVLMCPLVISGKSLFASE